ncbi:hypothetical protein [Mesoterricola sediminis]|nr:hypothetical protein [Mesoterricola sediminis]
MADNFDLMEELCRYNSHTHGEVVELLERFTPKDKQTEPGDLVVMGIIEAVESRDTEPFGSSIAVWLSEAFYNRANPEPAALVPPPKTFRIPLSDKLVGHRFARKGGHADDLLGWLREEFPEAGLREVLRSYHFLLKTTAVNRNGPRRTLEHPESTTGATATTPSCLVQTEARSVAHRRLLSGTTPCPRGPGRRSPPLTGSSRPRPRMRA